MRIVFALRDALLQRARLNSPFNMLPGPPCLLLPIHHTTPTFLRPRETLPNMSDHEALLSSMSDRGTESPTAQTLAERIETLCTEIAPLAEEFEAAESVFKNDPHIRAMRHSRSALSLGFIMPSRPHIAAATASYLAALPILEEILPRLVNCNERFTALESDCQEILEEYLDDSVELRSQIFRHGYRGTYLELFGLLGLIASLVGESEATLEYYVVCLEQAKKDDIGSTEWANSISPFLCYRRPMGRGYEGGDGGSDGEAEGDIEGELQNGDLSVA